LIKEISYNKKAPCILHAEIRDTVLGLILAEIKENEKIILVYNTIIAEKLRLSDSDIETSVFRPIPFWA
jgi:hypothetical protein